MCTPCVHRRGLRRDISTWEAGNVVLLKQNRAIWWTVLVENHLKYVIFIYFHHLRSRWPQAFSSCNGPGPQLTAVVGLTRHSDHLVDIECLRDTSSFQKYQKLNHERDRGCKTSKLLCNEWWRINTGNVMGSVTHYTRSCDIYWIVPQAYCRVIAPWIT